jgi:PAS domain S-box-containing protein
MSLRKPAARNGLAKPSRDGVARLSPKTDSALLRLTFDHLPDAVSVYDPQGKYEFSNRSWLQVMDRSLDEMLGHTDEELFPPAETRWYEPLLQAAIATRQTQAAECAVERSNGIEHKVVTMVPVVDDQGALRQVVATIRDVTLRARAQDSRDRMFAQSMNLVCIGGFDGYLKHWNPAWSRILGYHHEEMMAMHIQQMVHPDDWKLVSGNIAQLAVGQAISATEVRIRCKDGSYKWLLWNAVPCVEQQSYCAAGMDITARKNFEEQLRESQERFELIAGATKEAIWDWDLRENRIWHNRGYETIFCPPTDDPTCVQDWWLDRIHPDDRDRVLAAFPPRLVDGRQEWAREYRFRRVDGTYAHLFERGYVLFDAQRKAVRKVGSVLDISELKDAEEKLRQSEERFQMAAKATRDAIWDWDLRGGKVWRSEGFQTLFGYAAEEVAPDLNWWADRIHEADRDRILLQFRDFSRASSQQCAYEYRFRRADGTYADVLDRGSVMFDPEGQPIRVIGSMMDMSARRQAEEIAQMQRAELAHIARVSTMGEITTGLAHELNQPLTAISNYAESCTRAIVSRSSDRDQKLLSWVEKIAINTHRAGEIIRRLRGFTRKSKPERSLVEVNQLIEEVLDLLEGETRRQGIRVQWQRAASVQINVDILQIQQVLVNLLRNAFEAMVGNPPDRQEVTIALSTTDEQIEISVADAGEGISPENMDRVFDAFFTSKPNGVGVGLAISRSIAQDHGGQLSVVPNPQRGVTFRLTLPRSAAAPLPESQTGDDCGADRFASRQ